MSRFLPLTLMAIASIACSNGGSGATTSDVQTPREEDVMVRVAACMRDAGVNVQYDPITNSITGDRGGLTVAQTSKISARCRESVGLGVPTPPSQLDIERFYRWALKTADCLKSQGLAIGDPPTLQAYQDSYGTGPWSPYQYVPDRDLERFLRVCPQTWDSP